MNYQVVFQKFHDYYTDIQNQYFTLFRIISFTLNKYIITLSLVMSNKQLYSAFLLKISS